jgi:hypothetical protein
MNDIKKIIVAKKKIMAQIQEIQEELEMSLTSLTTGCSAMNT